MNKKRAKNIIIDCANIYKENLLNKSIIFIAKDAGEEIIFFEADFMASNFKHITGARSKLSSAEFFGKCIDKKFGVGDFQFASNGTTLLKVSVLKKLMNIHETAKWVGDYNGIGLHLETDKVAGDKVACLGFIKTGKKYSPNTALKQKIENVTVNETLQTVVAVLSKSRVEQKYNNILRCENDFDLMNALPEEVARKIDLGKLKTAPTNQNIGDSSINDQSKMDSLKQETVPSISISK